MPWEDTIRIVAFLSIFLSMAVFEVLSPRRVQAIDRWRRWPANIGVVLIGAALVRVTLPVAAVGAAQWAESRGWGLFNLVGMPAAISVVGSILLLDLTIYAQHRLFHAAPILWRLHRMHHTDLEIDVTTGARFHPIEILLSMALKMAVVVAIGAPIIGVVAFEIILNATSMFNHSNVRISDSVDRMLRLFIVTPDMHRVHHSIVAKETNSNFAFNLSLWDHLFGSYLKAPAAGHLDMTIGIPQFRDPGDLRLDRMLIQPFVSGP